MSTQDHEQDKGEMRQGHQVGGQAVEQLLPSTLEVISGLAGDDATQ